LLYNLKWNGQLDCYDAKTGEEYYKEKLGRALSFTASPVVADGILYAVSDGGKVYSVQCGKDFEVLATNDLNDICMVTPAITEGMIFFRTQDMLVAIGKK
jgi:outer membrane protein assembly factor BamB